MKYNFPLYLSTQSADTRILNDEKDFSILELIDIEDGEYHTIWDSKGFRLEINLDDENKVFFTKIDEPNDLDGLLNELRAYVNNRVKDNDLLSKINECINPEKILRLYDQYLKDNSWLYQLIKKLRRIFGKKKV